MTSKAPHLTVRAVEVFERAYALRMPFRFGGNTHTHGRQAVMRLRIRLANPRHRRGR